MFNKINQLVNGTQRLTMLTKIDQPKHQSSIIASGSNYNLKIKGIEALKD